MKSIVSFRRDFALTTIAIAILLPTCWHPYRPDQAMSHDFGAGGLRGHIPFRDGFDVKPPGIYALYALAVTVFG
jgi:hypothetical protein